MVLNAQTGTEIYERKCAVCHKIKPMMNKQKMMQLSKKECMIMKEKSHCMPSVLKKFRVMPAIAKGMSEKDIKTIANWLYNNFTEKWNPNTMGMKCKTKSIKNIKYGQGNGVISTPKDEEKTMKCAQGQSAGK